MDEIKERGEILKLEAARSMPAGGGLGKRT